MRSQLTLCHCACPVAVLLELSPSLSLRAQNVCQSACYCSRSHSQDAHHASFARAYIHRYVHVHVYVCVSTWCVCVCARARTSWSKWALRCSRRSASRGRAGDFISLPHTQTHTHSDKVVEVEEWVRGRAVSAPSWKCASLAKGKGY